jgi:hypothetical protein
MPQMGLAERLHIQQQLPLFLYLFLRLQVYTMSIEERIRKPWVKNEESLVEYLKHIKKFVISID